MSNRELAEQIYTIVFGHLDDKNFRAAKIQEITDWLDDGVVDFDATPEKLAAEWTEYDPEAEVNNED